MRRPSIRLTPNSVTVTRVSFGRDAALGRLQANAPDPTVYRVAVQPTATADLAEHLREQGVIYHTVNFYDDPRLVARDVVIFNGRTLAVVGVRGSSGGAGRTWPVLCEERPPRRGA